MEKLNVAIITLSQKVINFDCYMIVLPGVVGDFGVLYGHENMMTILREGEIKIYQDQYVIAQKYLMNISGAYVKINQTKCTIIAKNIILLNGDFVQCKGIDSAVN